MSELGPLVEPHVVRGRQNAILISDAALAIFDRLLQLEKEGYSIPAAVEHINKERLNQQNSNGHIMGNGSTTEGIQLDILAHQNVTIQHLQKEIDWLRKMIETKDQQLSDKDQEIRALTSGPGPEPTRFNRWQAFRIALLGR